MLILKSRVERFMLQVSLLFILGEIKKGIMNSMKELVLAEIRIVLLRVGELLIKERKRFDLFGEAIFGVTDHDTLKYVQYASILKMYGTKFVTMADSSILRESQ